MTQEVLSHLFDVVAAALLSGAGACFLVVWAEIKSLRKSRQRHALILQQHAQRFMIIGGQLGIEWQELQTDLLE